MEGLRAAECKLEQAGVSKKDWIYISANADYPPDTPNNERCGGFGCNRGWIEGQIRKYPKLFYTAVDAREIENVMQYIRGYTYYDVRTSTCTSGEAGIKELVEETIRGHRNSVCNCER
jgi:hypothetical protein